MKKLLSLILAMSVALIALPAKANSQSISNALTISSTVLITTGLASALLSYKLMKDYKKEEAKLQKIIQNKPILTPLSSTDYPQRAKKNFIRLTCGYAAGLLSFSTIPSGLLLYAYKCCTNN